MTHFKWILCASFLAVGLAGCAEEKVKKPAGIEGELKPLAPPGSPGGEKPAPGKAAPGGGANVG